MAILKAPYNFVPLSEKVVFPEWASLISQDIPFSDERSGVIKVKVTALTPIYVRNGYKAIDKQQMPAFKKTEEFRSFSKSPDNVYFIPATTVKGELRHIMEIVSFGKFDRINTKKYKVGKDGDREILKAMTQFIPQQHRQDKLDMAECVFGKVSKTDSLKGRVHISHALCTEERVFFADEKRQEYTISPYQGSPKPTYYPIYVEQTGREGAFGEVNTYKTYMGFTSKLRGWKMYPAREYWSTEFPQVNENQADNLNPAIPLGKDSQFEFYIRYHNLTKIELGALLYALNPADSSCHSLGFAKSFGYGVCKYAICYTNDFTQQIVEDARREFVDYMTEQLHPDIDYVTSPQIKELVAMMNPALATTGLLLDYMSLEDYKAVKEHNPSEDIYGQYLAPYSELVEYVTREEQETEDGTDIPEEQAPQNNQKPVPTAPQQSEGLLATVTFSQKQGNNMLLSITIEEGNRKGRKEKVTIPINVNNRYIKWNKVKQIKVDYQNGKYVFLKVL